MHKRQTTEERRNRHRRKAPNREPAALKRLRTIAAIRPEFANLETTEEIATTGASLALKHARAQTASVFLFDQVGRISRMALVGRDKDGHRLNNDSIPPEHHYPGESFTGKAVLPAKASPFGEAQYSTSLIERRDIFPAVRAYYSKVLGGLRSAVSVPLNGTHRTFGVLEVINSTSQAQSSFNVEDVHWLSLIANELALALSQRRHLQQSVILSTLAEAVVSMFSSTTEEQTVYKNVAESLTSLPLLYRVCVIRLRVGHELSTVAAASSEVPLEGFDASPLSPSHGWAGNVFKTGKPLYVQNISDRDPVVDHLLNWRWAIVNKLVSYVCVPLMIEEEVIGTLSLYFGFSYTIDEDEWSFLEALARFLAAFYKGRQILQDLPAIIREDARDAVKAEYESQIPSKHTFAEFLRTLENSLLEIRGVNLGTASGEKEYERVLNMVQDRLKQVREEISGPEMVDLNELIQSIISQRRRIPMRTHTQFVTHLKKIPLIRARTSALRHTIKDLIANAIKSIQDKDEGFGLITIETRLSRDKEGAERIELTVEDTGEGIPRENWEEIFEQGFSKYPDGTGLGLYIARNVLTSLSGSIKVASSTVGEGSKFHVVIPTWESEFR